MSGWISGSCGDDVQGTFIVFEERPEGSTEPAVVQDNSGRVFWVDTGSGPGLEVPIEDDQSGDR